MTNTTICATCQHPDGSLNTDYLAREGSCVFGCGTVIDSDMRMCSRCQDHSANRTECDTCGRCYEQWAHDGTWEIQP